MTPTIEVHLTPDELRAALGGDVLAGLTTNPKELPPKWFYDERGCELFDRITRLPEYYPTRCERSILTERAAEIAEVSGADTLIELGSGTSEKTGLVLGAMAETGRLRRIVVFDVNEPTLRRAATTLAAQYPAAEVRAVVGDFERHLGAIPGGGRRLVAFLGGTIGNLVPGQRARFLSELARSLAAGDGLLLGTDLVKDVARMEAAYDDAAGVTAEFNRNILHVVNGELAADFVPDRFAHLARFNEDEEWIEMWLRSTAVQEVRVADLGLKVRYVAGEDMRTEISAKFRRSGVAAELGAAGLAPARWWTDGRGDFGVSLSFKE
ncbi:MAG: L-histidine N(alpha)-methyltransferase [Actinomycetota bacterium]|nr:L-histidine N(alpha)-methyltransferase [Actinomycetota bacterium]